MPMPAFDELTLDGMQEARRCLVHVKQRLWEGGFRIEPVIDLHTCTSDCLLITHRGLCMCLRSDSMHLCTATNCIWMVETAIGEEVCSLTGTVFGSKFECTFSQNPRGTDTFDAAIRSQGHRSAVYKDRLERRGNKFENLMDKIDQQQSPSTSSSLPKKVANPAIRSRIQASVLDHNGSIRLFLSKLLPEIEERRRESLLKIVSQRWCWILQTPLFRESGAAYSIEAHTIAVLHAMAEGGYSYVPFDHNLAMELPDTQTLPQRLPHEGLGLKLCQQFTKRWTQFQNLIDAYQKHHTIINDDDEALAPPCPP